jgi:hypothetical protein
MKQTTISTKKCKRNGKLKSEISSGSFIISSKVCKKQPEGALNNLEEGYILERLSAIPHQNPTTPRKSSATITEILVLKDS